MLLGYGCGQSVLDDYCLLDGPNDITSALAVYLEVRNNALTFILYHLITHNTSTGFSIAHNVSLAFEIFRKQTPCKTHDNLLDIRSPGIDVLPYRNARKSSHLRENLLCLLETGFNFASHVM